MFPRARASGEMRLIRGSDGVVLDCGPADGHCVLVWSFHGSVQAQAQGALRTKEGCSFDDGRLEIHFRAGCDENRRLFMNHSKLPVAAVVVWHA